MKKIPSGNGLKENIKFWHSAEEANNPVKFNRKILQMIKEQLTARLAVRTNSNFWSSTSEKKKKRQMQAKPGKKCKQNREKKAKKILMILG